MGLYAHGVLAYGFDLGGRDSSWKLKGEAECEPWIPGWATAEQAQEIAAGEFGHGSLHYIIV